MATQTNANGATWSYFFAGYRSEEVDPHGTRRVLYYNPRGKARFDIQDHDGLNLVTQMAYDGLDRIVSPHRRHGPRREVTYDNTWFAWCSNRLGQPGYLTSYACQIIIVCMHDWKL